MGDKLPEILYHSLCSALGQEPGVGDMPGLDELPAEVQRAWDQVAAKARSELGRQFAIDMRDAAAVHGAEQAIANMLEARLGK